MCTCAHTWCPHFLHSVLFAIDDGTLAVMDGCFSDSLFSILVPCLHLSWKGSYETQIHLNAELQTIIFLWMSLPLIDFTLELRLGVEWKYRFSSLRHPTIESVSLGNTSMHFDSYTFTHFRGQNLIGLCVVSWRLRGCVWFRVAVWFELK